VGQVHKACLRDGDCIVVKVQYPGIDEVIEADMRTVKAIMRILRLLYSRVNLDVIYTEFSRIVTDELDYIKEGRNAETFARNFKDDTGIRIPLVYWPFTTSKVLTLEYLEGIKINDVTEIDARGIDRKEVSRMLAGAYARMFSSTGSFTATLTRGTSSCAPVRRSSSWTSGWWTASRGRSAKVCEGLHGHRGPRCAGRSARARGHGFIPLTKDIRPLVSLVERLLAKYRDMSLTQFKAMDIDEIGDDVLEACSSARRSRSRTTSSSSDGSSGC